MGAPWLERGGGLEGIYGRLTARCHDPAGDWKARRRIARRRRIHVDLRHTGQLLQIAPRQSGHCETASAASTIAIPRPARIGAFEARELADEIGVKVIVAEEVKTAEPAEVIDCSSVERGMTMDETIAEIRRQGGLVYVPHPFDGCTQCPTTSTCS